MIEKMNHYSMTAKPTIYDEEALTALELAARTAGKVNEVINLVNDLEKVMPDEIEKAIDEHIQNGGIDAAVGKYIGDVETRLDNLADLPEGSTTLDAELIDIRVDAFGKTHTNAGDSVRDNFRALNGINKNPIIDALGVYPTFTNQSTAGALTHTRITSDPVEITARPYLFAVPDGYQVGVQQGVVNNGVFTSKRDSGWLNTFAFNHTDMNTYGTFIRFTMRHVNDSAISPVESMALSAFAGEPDHGGLNWYHSKASGEQIDSVVAKLTKNPVKITAPNGHTLALYIKGDDKTTNKQIVTGSSLILPKGMWFVVRLTRDDGDVVNPETLNVLTFVDETPVKVWGMLKRDGFYDLLNQCNFNGDYNQKQISVGTLTGDQLTLTGAIHEIRSDVLEFGVQIVSDGAAVYNSGWVQRHTLPSGVPFVVYFRKPDQSIITPSDVYEGVEITTHYADQTKAIDRLLGSCQHRSWVGTGLEYTIGYKRMVSDPVQLDEPIHLTTTNNNTKIAYHIIIDGVKAYDSNWQDDLSIPANYPIRLYVKHNEEFVTMQHLDSVVEMDSRINYAALNENVRAIAHRGLSSQAPENTESAFRFAKAHGFKYVECDVRFTADNVPVLSHLDDVSGTSNLTKTVSTSNYNELENGDFGSWFNVAFAGEKLLTLSDMLRLCRDLGLHPYIELKTVPTSLQWQKIYDAMKAAAISDVAFLTFKYDMEWDDGFKNSPNLIKNARWGICLNDIDSMSDLYGLYPSLFKFINVSYDVLMSNVETIHGVIPGMFDHAEVFTVNDATAIKNLPAFVRGVTSDNLHAAKVLGGW